MASRGRARDRAIVRGRALEASVRDELRAARVDRNIAGGSVAAVLGISASQYSRLERGLSRGFSIEEATVALASVGLDLSVRVYPGGPPLREIGHAHLIDRFRTLCHETIVVRTEVPMPRTGDQRAWDVVLFGRGWVHPFEAETRPRDWQALERRIGLKSRDSDMGAASLLLLDSRYNRDFVRVHRTSLAERFPVPAIEAVRALRAGLDPGAGSLILL